MLKKNMKVGQKLVLPPGTRVWVVKSWDDIKAEKEEDRKTGRWHDEGGEPILCGRYSGATLAEVGLVGVTTKKPVWDHWRKKPSFLIGGFSKNLSRHVLFTFPKQ